jgi:hypothetical protein
MIGGRVVAIPPAMRRKIAAALRRNTSRSYEKVAEETGYAANTIRKIAEEYGVKRQ